MKDSALLLGRILMVAIFLSAGYSKLTHYEYMQGYMVSLGVPGWSMPFIILWELGGGLAILLGLFTRPVALLLAGFCVISALIAHLHPADQEQMINFMKNLSMTGGFIYVAATGAGAFSLDDKFKLKWS
ncbi:MAG: DoxX family protein [Gammaproteobacteria bacterium]